MCKREIPKKIRNKESGMALLIVLLALFLVSAIGMGMMYMSTTETSINANYRDTQQAFFAMRGGLEEMRDRIRTNAPSPVALPTVTPTNATAGSVVYILNPTGSETIDPTSTAAGNTYFDDEFCHETFSTMTGLAVPASLSLPCVSGGAVPSTAVTTYASISPYTGTSSALKYKWVRITMKQNNTFSTAIVNSSASSTGQVCWDAGNAKEVVVTTLGAYTTCLQAQNAGLLVAPIYIITSLAITPQGSRRIGQYEVAAISITPPPAGLAMAGAGAVIPSAPSSNNFFINGNNSGTGGYTGGPACHTTTPASAAAIATGSSTGVTNIVTAIPSNRYGNFTGVGGTTPNVVDEGSDAGGNGLLSGLWSSPSQLNNLVSSLGNGADNQLTCGIGGVFPTGITTASPGCSTGTYGTDAAPQITYVNGDYNLTGGSGVLIVTGTLNVTGNSSFNGLILVVGQGILSESGGGNGQYNGSLFIANTNAHSSPFTQLTTLGTPSFAWNGGGTNGIQYNSCWANLENDLHYQVVSSREEMY
jgi:Tfp pilus assembly protein PilX